MKSHFFTDNSLTHDSDHTPTIGIVGVTIPGAADCLNKINQKCREHLILNEQNCKTRVLDTTDILADAAIKRAVELRHLYKPRKIKYETKL